jgi:transcriptional regulator with XRE-family HTH domain
MTEEKLNQARQKIVDAFVARRRELQISQDELAARSGMGVATIRRFESGRYWLHLKQYLILREALGMPEIE